MVTGTTLIDHRIRAELNLSLQEYVVMDYLNLLFTDKLGEPTEDNCVKMIAVNLESVIPIINKLSTLGFHHYFKPTEKWTNAFKKPKKEAKKGFVPPTLDEVKEYFKEKGYSAAGATKAYEYYSVADWADGRGNKVKNWKQKMLANWFKDEYKQTQSTGITLETKVYNR